MANGDDSEEESGGGTSGGDADAAAKPPHRHPDPAVPASLLGVGRSALRRGRPRWSTVALVLIFASALVLYVTLRPGG